jgi:hypothetical protein
MDSLGRGRTQHGEKQRDRAVSETLDLGLVAGMEEEEEENLEGAAEI